MQQIYRPFGQMGWLLERLTQRRWSLLGCIGAEQRCLSTWRLLKSKSVLLRYTLLSIEDRQSGIYLRVSQARYIERLGEFNADGGQMAAIEPHSLDEIEDEIISAADRFLAESSENIVIDISSLPKRFFFPILKRILGSPAHNIIVTYTIPESYAPGSLAEDLDTWKPLPTFRPPIDEPEQKTVFVGLGFEPHSLPQLLGQDFRSARLSMFFPLPPGPPGYQRNWEFVRRIDQSIGGLPYALIPVSALDVGGVFDYLRKETDGCSQYAILAPYGPKPMSLAMCLFAICAGDSASVYYTQPRVYNPDYSIGVRESCGEPAIQAYLVRSNSTDLYLT